MNLNRHIWTTFVFIINCGVFAYFTTDIESKNSKVNLLRTDNVNKNIVDLNLPLDDKSFNQLDNNIISLEDNIQSRDSIGRKLQTDLRQIAKRSWRRPFFIRSFKPRPDHSSMNRRRSQPLSVTGALSSLANMLAAEGRRRQQNESINNRMRLLELGKRKKEFSKAMPESDLTNSDSDLKSPPYVYR